MEIQVPFKLLRTRSFAEHLSEASSYSEAQMHFMTTHIREVREASLHGILETNPRRYGSDWVENAIRELGRVGEDASQDRMLGWYAKKTCDVLDPSSVRMFRFLFAFLDEEHAKKMKMIQDLINEVVKMQPRLYWAADITEFYLAHFKSMVGKSNWGTYTLEQWETAARYIRRIVENEDTRYLYFLREWLEAHKRGITGPQIESALSKPVPPNWDAPNRIRAFLGDAVERLKAAEELQQPQQSFAEAMIKHCLYDKENKKKYEFTDPFEMKFCYPDVKAVSEATKAEEPVEITILIKDMPEHRWNVKPLQQLMCETDIDLDIEGGVCVRSSNLNGTLYPGRQGCFNPRDGSMKFMFTPLTKHQRVKLTFRQKGKVVGTWTHYFPGAPLHVW